MAFAGDTNVGHVPDSSAAAAGSFLKADGSWTVPPDTNTTDITLTTTGTSGAATWNSGTNTLNIPQYAGTPYTLPLATSSVRGGVKIGATGLAAKNYAIELDGNERMYVAVPWTDTNTTNITLTTTGTSGAATWNGTTLNIPQYAGTTYSAATSSALGLLKIGSDTEITATLETGTGGEGVSNRAYPVQFNASSQAAVYVPWTDTDTNTTYTMSAATDGSNVDLTLDASAGTDTTIQLTAGSNMSITQSGGNNITFASTAAGGGGSSGGFPSTIPANETASFTAVYNNFHKVATSSTAPNIVVTLPATATGDKTKIIGIKWVAEQGGGASNTVIIKTPGSGVTIDSDTNSHTTGLALGAVNNYYELITDGANWWIK